MTGVPNADEVSRGLQVEACPGDGASGQVDKGEKVGEICAVSTHATAVSATANLEAMRKQVAAERSRVANAHLFRLNTRRAAKYIGICKRTLEYMRERGEGPPYIQIGKHVWYELPAIFRWLERQTPGRYGPADPPGPPEPPQTSGALPPIGNLTRIQAAKYLGICVRTLDYWRGQPGKPQPMNNGTKRVRYSIAELDAWLKAQTRGA